MYTSHIGKQFIQLYNRKNNTQYTAKEFFNEVFYPLFYYSEDYRFLQTVHSSTFSQIHAKYGGIKARIRKEKNEQKKTMLEQELATLIPSQVLSDALHTLESKISDGQFAGNTFVGFGAQEYDNSGEPNTTTGQVSNIQYNFTEQDAYASWIGGALGIGASKLTILIDDEDVMLATSEGWKYYRSYCNQTEGIDNKIESWNGIWLKHRFSESFNEQRPTFGDFNPIKLNKDGNAELNKVSWIDIHFALSLFLKKNLINVYVYQIGKTNKTLGFVSVILKHMRKLYQYYQDLFPNEAVNPKQFAELYETEWGFERACENGAIGLRELKPKDLIPSTNDYEKSQITFNNYNIYITWIIAMLQKPEFWTLAVDFAKELSTIASSNTRGKTTEIRQVEELLETTHRDKFIENLTQIAKDFKEITSISHKVVYCLHHDIPHNDFKYFLTLVRFMYFVPNIINL